MENTKEVIEQIKGLRADMGRQADATLGHLASIAESLGRISDVREADYAARQGIDIHPEFRGRMKDAWGSE